MPFATATCTLHTVLCNYVGNKLFFFVCVAFRVVNFRFCEQRTDTWRWTSEQCCNYDRFQIRWSATEEMRRRLFDDSFCPRCKTKTRKKSVIKNKWVEDESLECMLHSWEIINKVLYLALSWILYIVSFIQTEVRTMNAHPQVDYARMRFTFCFFLTVSTI